MKMKLMPIHDTCIVSFSFGNYLKADGGTDKLIAEHQKIFNSHGVSYIQIAPIKYRADHYHISGKTASYYTLAVDGGFYGIVTEAEMDYFLGMYVSSVSKISSIIIHHFSKFEISFFEQTISKTKKCPVIVYLHDFYTVCTQLNLLKNNKEFCGKTEKNSVNCKDCSYAECIDAHQEQIASLLSKFQNRVLVVAPSRSTLNIWKQSYLKRIPYIKTAVVPHLSFEGVNPKLPAYNDKLKIAFIGKYSRAKGKEAFESLVEHCTDKYDYYYLGASNIEDQSKIRDKVKSVYVKVDKDHPAAMTDALEKQGINVVMLWSLWPETYSYTYYEAFQKNKFILTTEESGNIADEVLANKNGKVFDSIFDLIDYCSSDELAMDYKRFCSGGVRGPLRVKPSEEIYNLSLGYDDAYDGSVKKLPSRTLLEVLMEFLYRKKNGFEER